MDGQAEGGGLTQWVRRGQKLGAGQLPALQASPPTSAAHVLVSGISVPL